MAFNWPFSNYGFYGFLGISVNPIFHFCQFFIRSSSGKYFAVDANRELWTNTGSESILPANALTKNFQD